MYVQVVAVNSYNGTSITVRPNFQLLGLAPTLQETPISQWFGIWFDKYVNYTHF